MKFVELYKTGHIIKKDDPAAGVAAFNYQDSITKEYARYGFATIKAYALLREKYTQPQTNFFLKIFLMAFSLGQIYNQSTEPFRRRRADLFAQHGFLRRVPAESRDHRVPAL
jgi:hypothetical protein